MALPESLKTRLTWEQYLQSPESNELTEIEDGEVKRMASPTGRHQMVLGNLYLLIRNHPVLRERGTVLTAPFDVVVQREPLRVRQPDLLFILRERLSPQEVMQAQRLEIAPDLVVEVLSASDTFQVLARKLGDYHQLGVQEVWLIDAEQSQAFVLLREEKGWHWQGPFAGSAEIPSQVLSGAQFTAQQIFAVAGE